jgi:CBS domain-containing protein
MSGSESSAPKRTAADIMTPSPRTCSTFSTVLEAVLIFRDADCGAVPVLDNGKPVGILTDRDVALAVADAPDLPSRLVAEIMSKGAVTVPSDATLEAIREKFGNQAVRRLLVVDAREQLIGIIAWQDIERALPDRALGQMVAEVLEHK